MSEEFESLYEREVKAKSGKSSPEKGIVRMKGVYVDNFGAGGSETVDLSLIGVEGECCPHIRDVRGAALIKGCLLQVTAVYSTKGVEKEYGGCGPRAYINHWKKCPYRGSVSKGGEGL